MTNPKNWKLLGHFVVVVVKFPIIAYMPHKRVEVFILRNSPGCFHTRFRLHWFWAEENCTSFNLYWSCCFTFHMPNLIYIAAAVSLFICQTWCEKTCLKPGPILKPCMTLILFSSLHCSNRKILTLTDHAVSSLSHLKLTPTKRRVPPGFEPLISRTPNSWSPVPRHACAVTLPCQRFRTHIGLQLMT